MGQGACFCSRKFLHSRQLAVNVLGLDLVPEAVSELFDNDRKRFDAEDFGFGNFDVGPVVRDAHLEFLSQVEPCLHVISRVEANCFGAAQPRLGGITGDDDVSAEDREFERRPGLVAHYLLIDGDFGLQIEEVDESAADFADLCGSLIGSGIEHLSGPGRDLVKQQLRADNQEQCDQQKDDGKQIPLLMHIYKKYSPPHPLDTKGCCSPQNNP